ncbi:MAG: nucleotidyltransferase [Planctomycetota bacterium]|jgi:predicted nucleotidyltransferase|nr:nucleotidyltransferase [Planctomycetota bacterium]MDP7133964.1 nucleotidyltransferase [Planctomycetota bacterium]MDP7249578.1 nucleotidyltransferase [Planctomycetota bacterium]
MSSPESPFAGELFEALKGMAEVLNLKSTDYALIGGLGLAIRGPLRSTRDVDLLLTVNQIDLPPLLDDLKERGFSLDVVDCIRQWRDDHLLEIYFGQIRVDWLKANLPIFQEILRRAKWEDIDGNSIRVGDAESLIILKLIAFRPRDQEDIRGILGANSAALDLDWVREEWAKLEKLDPSRTEAFEQLVEQFYQS